MARRDDAEFEAFVVARSAQLRRVSYFIVRDWQQAEDAVQTALANLYVAWPRIRRREAVDAYARRAVVNTSISWTRKHRLEVLTDTVPDSESVPGPHVADDALLEALRRLAPSQAAVVGLRYIEDLSVADVADLLNISAGTVKSHSSRGLTHLRRALDTTEHVKD